MKSILVLSVFLFFFLNIYSQSNEIPRLGIEKQFKNSPKGFIFIPNSSLRIKTLDGRKFFSRNYSVTEKSIVMNFKDSILFENISWIQGNVYFGGGRKVLGLAVILISSPIIAICIGETVIAGGVIGYFVSIPFIWMGYEGTRLISARRFHLSRECYIKAIEQ